VKGRWNAEEMTDGCRDWISAVEPVEPGKSIQRDLAKDIDAVSDTSYDIVSMHGPRVVSPTIPFWTTAIGHIALLHYFLPGHSTHLLQPLDVGLFSRCRGAIGMLSSLGFFKAAWPRTYVLAIPVRVLYVRYHPWLRRAWSGRMSSRRTQEMWISILEVSTDARGTAEI